MTISLQFWSHISYAEFVSKYVVSALFATKIGINDFPNNKVKNLSSKNVLISRLKERAREKEKKYIKDY